MSSDDEATADFVDPEQAMHQQTHNDEANPCARQCPPGLVPSDEGEPATPSTPLPPRRRGSDSCYSSPSTDKPPVEVGPESPRSQKQEFSTSLSSSQSAALLSLQLDPPAEADDGHHSQPPRDGAQQLLAQSQTSSRTDSSKSSDSDGSDSNATVISTTRNLDLSPGDDFVRNDRPTNNHRGTDIVRPLLEGMSTETLHAVVSALDAIPLPQLAEESPPTLSLNDLEEPLPESDAQVLGSADDELSQQ